MGRFTKNTTCVQSLLTQVAHGTEVDAIALRGSLVYSKVLLESLTRKISYIAPIHLNPGEYEMEALAEAAVRCLNHEEELSTYATCEPITLSVPYG